MLLQLLKISGISLYPVYRDGDFVLISKIPILVNEIHPGDVVVFEHHRFGKLIKLVERLEDGGRSLFVVGLDAESVDSRTFGKVPVNWVLGKVIWHISKK